MPVDGDIVLKAGLDSSGISKQLDGLQKTISKGLKNALRIGFGVRSIYALIRKLRTALFKGFGELAQAHQPFNDAMSSIMTSLNLLRNSFASAFAPIIETVAPAITTFINLIANAVSHIGMFIAALTGKEFVQATVTQQNYAESVNSSTSSTKKQTSATKQQTKAQKELNREITHFDDLVILHNKDQEDSNATSPAGATTPTSSFIATPIGSAVSAFAEQFKSAWEKADFFDIGRMLGEKLKVGLQNIPWEGIKEILGKIATSIATFLNGFLSTPGLFYTIGSTLAQALNSAFEFAGNFVSTFDWKTYGLSLKARLLGFINNLDWPTIYKTAENLGAGIGTALQNAWNDANLWKRLFTTLNNAIKAVVRLALNILDGVSWKDLGTNIGIGLTYGMNNIPWDDIFELVSTFGTDLADFLNGLFTEETFSALGTTVAQLLNTAFEFLNSFGETFDFGKFGVSLATGINSFLQKFSPLRLASGILTFIHGFHDTLVSFLSEVHWYDFGAKVSQLIKDIPWATLLQNIGEVVWTAINAAIEFFKGLFNVENIESPFTTAIEKLQDTINRASELINFQAIADGVKAVVEALAPAIEGFGVGFVAVFEALLKVGISFLSELGPALSSIADAIKKVPPEVLTALGTALGVIVGSLFAFNMVSSAIGLIATFATNLGKLVVPAKNATTALMGGGGAATGGLVKALGQTTVGLGAFLATLEATKLEISDSQDTYLNTTDIWYGLGDALENAASQSGVTYQELMNLLSPIQTVSSDDGLGFINTMDQIATSLDNAGISTDTLKGALQTMLDSGALSIDDAAVIESYIANIGKSADTSSEQTSDLQGVFGLFDDVSWTTALKLALISGAIEALGSKGAISDEQSQELQKTLDAYNPKKPEKSMEKIQKAFENTGISAQDFAGAMATACINADTETKQELGKVADSIKKFDEVAKQNSETAAKNMSDGYTQTLKSKTGEAEEAGGNLVNASLDGMEDEGEMHSPSKATQRLGGYMGQGLFIGLEQQKQTLTTLAGTIISSILSAIESYKTQFKNAGRDLLASTQTGITDKRESLYSTMSSTASNMKNKFSSVSWYNLGYNIAVGIYNGLFASSSWLQTLAWNTAVRMYNSACRALGIHSPSRKFAYVGEMITEGLGEGILDNESNALNAVDDMTDAITDKAEEANPTMALDTSVNSWIDSLDDVLTKFSETIIDRFDGMINALVQLTGFSQPIPAVAQGRVVPSSIATDNESATTLNNIANALENLKFNQLTADDLRPLLVEMFTEYMNFGWYVGDEQLARHANNGNLILGRRYSTIK